MGTSGDVIVSNGAASIRAGRGEDVVCMTNGDTRVVLEGGSGRDRWFPAMPVTDLTIDAGESVRVDDREPTELGGVESFHLERALPESLTFVGTGVGESLYFFGADYYGPAPRTLDVDLRGGQDVVQIGPDMAGELRAGIGRDQLRYHYGFQRPAGVSLRLAAIPCE